MRSPDNFRRTWPVSAKVKKVTKVKNYRAQEHPTSIFGTFVVKFLVCLPPASLCLSGFEVHSRWVLLRAQPLGKELMNKELFRVTIFRDRGQLREANIVKAQFTWFQGRGLTHTYDSTESTKNAFRAFPLIYEPHIVPYFPVFRNQEVQFLALWFFYLN